MPRARPTNWDMCKIGISLPPPTTSLASFWNISSCIWQSGQGVTTQSAPSVAASLLIEPVICITESCAGYTAWKPQQSSLREKSIGVAPIAEIKSAKDVGI